MYGWLQLFAMCRLRFDTLFAVIFANTWSYRRLLTHSCWRWHGRRCRNTVDTQKINAANPDRPRHREFVCAPEKKHTSVLTYAIKWMRIMERKETWVRSVFCSCSILFVKTETAARNAERYSYGKRKKSMYCTNKTRKQQQYVKAFFPNEIRTERLQYFVIFARK